MVASQGWISLWCPIQQQNGLGPVPRLCDGNYIAAQPVFSHQSRNREAIGKLPLCSTVNVSQPDYLFAWLMSSTWPRSLSRSEGATQVLGLVVTPVCQRETAMACRAFCCVSCQERAREMRDPVCHPLHSAKLLIFLPLLLSRKACCIQEKGWYAKPDPHFDLILCGGCCWGLIVLFLDIKAQELTSKMASDVLWDLLKFVWFLETLTQMSIHDSSAIKFIFREKHLKTYFSNVWKTDNQVTINKMTVHFLVVLHD